MSGIGALEFGLLTVACISVGAINCLLLFFVLGQKSAYFPLGMPLAAVAFSERVPWVTAGLLALFGHMLMGVALGRYPLRRGLQTKAGDGLYLAGKNEPVPTKSKDDGEVFRIWHWYDDGDRSEFVRRLSGNVDAMRAAVFVWFKCEEYFGETADVSNEGIAEALQSFYGFARCGRVPDAVDIEMWQQRAWHNGTEYRPLMSDASLHRDGLKAFMRRYVTV